MKYNSFLDFQKASLCKDVIFPAYKSSALLPSAVVRPAGEVKISLGNKKGVSLCVKKGSRVNIGTLIGEDETLPIYSSVSGKVTSAKRDDGFVCIEVMGDQKTDETLKKPRISSAKSLIKAFKDCGLNEYEKLTAEAETLIINCCESDPFITANCLCMTEDYGEIFRAVYMLKKHLNLKNVIFAIDGKTRATLNRFTEIIGNNQEKYEGVRVMWMASFVPKDQDEILAYYVLGKERTKTAHFVLSLQTVAKFGEYIKTGIPFVTKRVTVDGIVANPKNVIAPIGTPANEIFDFCGGLTDIPSLIATKGALAHKAEENGYCVQKDTDCLLVKGVIEPSNPTACMACGRCADYCVMGLYPSEIEDAVLKNDGEKLSKLNLDKCIGCGVCDYVCPAARPLCAAVKMGKEIPALPETTKENKLKSFLERFKKGDKENG